MFGSVVRKCRRCGHRVPIDSTVRCSWGHRVTWVCQPCALELQEQASAYSQGELKFRHQPFDDQEPRPF